MIARQENEKRMGRHSGYATNQKLPLSPVISKIDISVYVIYIQVFLGLGEFYIDSDTI